MKEPKLRFPEFTGAWEQRKLSEFVDKAVDNRGKTPPLDENGTHPLIEVAALGEVHPNYSKVDKYLNDDSYENNLRAYIKKGDILFTTVGSIGLVSIMDSREEAAIAQNIVAFRAKEGFIPEYLYALFLNEENQHKSKRIAMGAVQPSIKVSQLVDVEYMITKNVKEQTKIGSCFANLDNLIQSAEKELECYRELKQGMLQKMFPKNGEKVPEIRFPEFTDDWEQRKLGEVATFINGRAYSQDELLCNGKYKVLRVGNFYTNDSWYYSDMELDEKYYANDGDLLYTWSATFGPHIWHGGKVIYHYHIWKIELSDMLEKRFAVQLLEQDKAKILSDKNGSTMVHITKSGMEQKEVLLPSSVAEQARIGAYFENLENLITLQQKELDGYKELKKGLLQQMFC